MCVVSELCLLTLLRQETRVCQNTFKCLYVAYLHTALVYIIFTHTEQCLSCDEMCRSAVVNVRGVIVGNSQKSLCQRYSKSCTGGCNTSPVVGVDRITSISVQMCLVSFWIYFDQTRKVSASSSNVPLGFVHFQLCVTPSWQSVWKDIEHQDKDLTWLLEQCLVVSAICIGVECAQFRLSFYCLKRITHVLLQGRWNSPII